MLPTDSLAGFFPVQRPPRLTAGRWYEYSSCAALYIYETTARSVKVGVSSTMTGATIRITRDLISDKTHAGNTQ